MDRVICKNFRRMRCKLGVRSREKHVLGQRRRLGNVWGYLITVSLTNV